jgi:hypothetical protein
VIGNPSRNVSKDLILQQSKNNGSNHYFHDKIEPITPFGNNPRVPHSHQLANPIFSFAATTKNNERFMSQPETACLNNSDEDLLTPETPKPSLPTYSIQEIRRSHLSNGAELSEKPNVNNSALQSNFEAAIDLESGKIASNLKLPTQHSPRNDFDHIVQSRRLPLKNLKNLYYLLLKFLKNKEVVASDVASLKNHELEILNLIIKRKYETKLFSNENQRKDSKFVAHALEVFQNKLAVKRPEESYKFIFTRAIKHLKKMFRARRHLTSQFADHDGQFYNYYFGEMARVLKIPIESFIYPQPATVNCGRYKSLNLDYFKHVFLCEQFIQDLRLYLAAEMHRDYELEIERKTQHLLIKWDDQFSPVKEGAQFLDSLQGMSKKLHYEISHYFLQNKRCKLPWSMGELENAISRLSTLFTKLVKNEDLETST